MTIVAFAGPSLLAADRAGFDGIRWLPPAEAGDLLRLERDVATVCLIDGYFDHRPAVRHKEILLLLSRGARIYGASSIGALRAAEMQPFGMIGIGAIHRAYRRGTIVGDDEVALVHGPREWDWRPVSLPLVDLRATIVRGRRCGDLSARQARALITAGAGIHYVDRSWDRVVDALPAADRSARLLDRLKRCDVSQKRVDARDCLEAALSGRLPSAGPPPAMVRTVFIDELARDCGLEI